MNDVAPVVGSRTEDINEYVRENMDSSAKILFDMGQDSDFSDEVNIMSALSKMNVVKAPEYIGKLAELYPERKGYAIALLGTMRIDLARPVLKGLCVDDLRAAPVAVVALMSGNKDKDTARSFAKALVEGNLTPEHYSSIALDADLCSTWSAALKAVGNHDVAGAFDNAVQGIQNFEKKVRSFSRNN